jgi:hypothetical protein
VCSFLKPGASINRIVNSQEMEFKCLGKKDVIVINGGSYDIDKSNINRNRIVVMMTEFMLKYNNNNNNIVLGNIPRRYVLAKDSKVNIEIQAINDKLSKIAVTYACCNSGIRA